VPTTPEPLFNNPPLLLHARLIDDAIQICDADKLPLTFLGTLTEHMTTAMRFGILNWEVDSPAHTVNFLNLSISIEPNGQITTKTFIKPMNLHLYIPPTSGGVLKSLIFGNLQRYWRQNTTRHAFIWVTADFYRHLLNRGYTPVILTPIFQEAAATIQSKRLLAAQQADSLHDEFETTSLRRVLGFTRRTYQDPTV
jgi:hypothetical protein